MKGRGLLALTLVLGAAACGTESTVPPSDVVKVAICPSGGCPRYADGQSLIPVEVTVNVPDDELQSSLTLTLRTSSGAWSTPTDVTSPSVISQSLTTNTLEFWLTPSTTADAFDVVAELAGDQSVASTFFEPAPVGTPEVVPAPASLVAGMTNVVALSVTVPGKNGAMVSRGTMVDVTATSTPSDHVQVFPSSAVVGDDGTASVEMVASADVTKVDVSVVATPPPGADPAAKPPPASPAVKFSLTP